MITEEFIKATYPLHWSIWNNNIEELKTLLASGEVSRHLIVPSYLSNMRLSVSFLVTYLLTDNFEVFKCFIVIF